MDVARIGVLETSLTEVNDSLTSELESLKKTVDELSDDLQQSVTILQEDVDGLTVATDDLLVSFQETDAGLMDDIAQLSEVDGTLDSRLSQLEVDGTVVALETYTTIPDNSVVVFSSVNLNLGGGYSESTGQFTTPSGGARLYYFHAHFVFDNGEFAWLNTTVSLWP